MAEDNTDTSECADRCVTACSRLKLAFHGANSDTDTVTDFPADILARIVARMSACR